MTILELIQKTASYFEKAGVPNPRLDVELILAHALELKRMDLYLQFERQLSEGELEILRPLVKRRVSREPLQHILGAVEFFGVSLAVSPHALIPRPETEILVETIISRLGRDSDALVLDIGTGTGAIAIALAHHCPRLRCIATDISEEALALARRNAERAGDVRNRVEFRQGNLFEPIQTEEIFDLIVSNPPYIPSHEIRSLQPEVRYDPSLALDGGPEGLTLVQKIISQSSPFLKKGGWLFLEIGHDQAEAVRLFFSSDLWDSVDFIRDLQNIPRIAQARRI